MSEKMVLVSAEDLTDALEAIDACGGSCYDSGVLRRIEEAKSGPAHSCPVPVSGVSAPEDVAGWLRKLSDDYSNRAKEGHETERTIAAIALQQAADAYAREHPATPAGASTSCNLAHPPDWRCYVCHVPPSPRKQGRVEHCGGCRGDIRIDRAINGIKYQDIESCAGIRRES